MISKTTVSDLRYTDLSYPGNRFGEQLSDSYYEVTFWQVARQYEKYRRLERALLSGIEHVFQNNEPHTALSSEARDLKHWMHQPGGFTCQHMPWKIVLPRELYRPFIYCLRIQDTEAGHAAYDMVRRYGSWV